LLIEKNKGKKAKANSFTPNNLNAKANSALKFVLNKKIGYPIKLTAYFPFNILFARYE
jgi:hypothetical protein